jgi:hypothetical protein
MHLDNLRFCRRSLVEQIEKTLKINFTLRMLAAGRGSTADKHS